MVDTLENTDFTRAAARAGAGRMLALLLSTPLEKGDIASLRAPMLLDGFEEYLEALDIDVPAALGVIRSTLEKVPAGSIAVQLNIEATRLFSIGVDAVPASPYESVWMDPGHELAGRSAATVAATYGEHGVAVADGKGDLLPDHVAREFEFLSLADRQRALALRSGDRAAAEHWFGVAERFRIEHLEPWVPRWAGAVATDASSPFFTAVAGIAAELAVTPGGRSEPRQ